jgi:hypothetical protein
MRTALVLLLLACIGGGVSELEAARWQADDPLPDGGSSGGAVLDISPASTAWVTFLDTSVPGFVLGAVVLGHSIRKHSVDSSRQMVCLVAGPPLTSAAQHQLEAAGWELTNVPSIANPMAHHPAKLKRVFSKLAILGLPFSRVVYLDADTLVVSQGAEKLFLCPATICGASWPLLEAFVFPFRFSCTHRQLPFVTRSAGTAALSALRRAMSSFNQP